MGDLFERVQQFAGEVVDSGGEGAQAGGELVVGDCGRNGDEDAGGGGDEGFGDAGSDGAEGRGAGGSKAVEGVDDAPDSAEEADEGAGGGYGREPGEALFEAGEGFAAGGLCGALERRNVSRRAVAASLPLVGFVDFVEDEGQRAGL